MEHAPQHVINNLTSKLDTNTQYEYKKLYTQYKHKNDMIFRQLSQFDVFNYDNIWIDSTEEPINLGKFLYTKYEGYGDSYRINHIFENKDFYADNNNCFYMFTKIE